MGPPTSSFPEFFLLPEIERKWVEGKEKNREKLSIKQIKLLYISFDVVGLSIQRILILYKN